MVDWTKHTTMGPADILRNQITQQTLRNQLNQAKSGTSGQLSASPFGPTGSRTTSSTSREVRPLGIPMSPSGGGGGPITGPISSPGFPGGGSQQGGGQGGGAFYGGGILPKGTGNVLSPQSGGYQTIGMGPPAPYTSGNMTGADYGVQSLVNSLNQPRATQYGANAIMGTAFDPQNALYNRTAQQVQDRARVGQAARGITSSPYGAGLENDAMSNFNIDWQNQQLGRQAQGLGAAGGVEAQTSTNQQAGLQGLLDYLRGGRTAFDQQIDYYKATNPQQNTGGYASPSQSDFNSLMERYNTQYR